MKRLFIFYLLSGVIQLNAQIVTVYGLVKNSEGDSLPLAIVKYGNSSQSYTRTKKDGTYEFTIEKSLLKEIKVFYSKHQDLNYLLSEIDYSNIINNRLEINFMMFDRILKEVIVGTNLPDTFFKSDDFSVADFEIDKNGQVILLTYPKKLMKGSAVKVLDENQKVIDTYQFPGRAIKLETDYRKNVHLITKEHVYLVAFIDQEIQLLQEDVNHYFKFVSPILDTLDDKFYYSNYSEIYPAFNYFQFNTTDSVYTVLLDVIDEPLMEQYRAEFKFSDVRTRLWAANKEIESGIDKEIWVGAAIFSNSIYYDPLYAPLFVNRDSILVFDHYKNLMFKYSNDLTYCDSFPISYHENARKTGWEQPIIQDKVSGKIYVLFEKNGYSYLSLVDLSTGKIKYSRKLYFRYAENIKIINNKVYYIYRPFESIQKKYIYTENINI
ncbi:MAG: hypothetical protein AB8B74_08940 [Crocinitomicaceae bacterium]